MTSAHKGIELSRTPVELKGGDWFVKVVPWIGGRIISMMHLPSGSTLKIIFLSLLYIYNVYSFYDLRCAIYPSPSFGVCLDM